MHDLYIKMIDKYIESGKMREYLKSIVDELSKWQIIDLICGARADLRDKYESLLQISELETDEEKKEHGSAFNRAKAAEELLEELELKKGEIFLNIEYCYDYERDDEEMIGAAPYTSLKSVMKYVEDEYAELNKKEREDATYWYRLEKYAQKSDKMQLKTIYNIAPNGEIWSAYFDYEYKDEERHFVHGGDLNLPVPFEIGDIITIDCRPFAPVKHGIIIEKGDNRDCCCVQVVHVVDDFVTGEAIVHASALKHASSLIGYRHYNEISPLCRAEVFKGRLNKEEKMLREISKFLRGDEKIGRALWHFLIFDKKCNGITGGVTYKRLKEKMTPDFMERLYSENAHYKEYVDRFGE